MIYINQFIIGPNYLFNLVGEKEYESLLCAVTTIDISIAEYRIFIEREKEREKDRERESKRKKSVLLLGLSDQMMETLFPPPRVRKEEKEVEKRSGVGGEAWRKRILRLDAL